MQLLLHGKIRGLAEEAAVNNERSQLKCSEDTGVTAWTSHPSGFLWEKTQIHTGQRFSKSRVPGRRFTMVVFTSFIAKTVFAASKKSPFLEAREMAP